MPGLRGVTQPGQPHQRDDDGVLDGIERISAVPQQSDGGCVQRRPASLEQARQGLLVAASRQRHPVRPDGEAQRLQADQEGPRSQRPGGAPLEPHEYLDAQKVLPPLPWEVAAMGMCVVTDSDGRDDMQHDHCSDTSFRAAVRL